MGLQAVVEGLRANPQAQRRVPERLMHYLCEPILPSAWYPEKDYNVLIEALALGLDRRVAGDDVWSFFGRVGAQRDIAGEQSGVPVRSRVKVAGVYRNFRAGAGHDVGGFFQRAARLWSLYHDSGRALVARSPREPGVVLLRILNFDFPLRGLVAVQSAFTLEYARLLGFRLEVALLRSAADGEPFCEWSYRVEPSAEQLASLAVLPLDVV